MTDGTEPTLVLGRGEPLMVHGAGDWLRERGLIGAPLRGRPGWWRIDDSRYLSPTDMTWPEDLESELVSHHASRPTVNNPLLERRGNRWATTHPPTAEEKEWTNEERRSGRRWTRSWRPGRPSPP